MADCIEIKKSERTLVWRGRAFPIALGVCPTERKEREGDGKTPEGEYYICTKNDKSKFHLSLGISYPNEQDAKKALDDGAITKAEFDRIALAQRAKRRPPWDTALGGFIMIHGGGTASDWTQGCVALCDNDMDILFEEVPLGTVVRILP